MALHTLDPTRETLHGAFSPDLAPALTIDPGDMVRFRTLDAGWHLAPINADEPDATPRFSPRIRHRDNGHALCGPVAIRGAHPGMVLGVRIDALVPGEWGWTEADGADTPRNRALGVVGAGAILRWTLDVASMIGTDQHGHRVALRPFLGVMGVAPAAPGWHPSWPPRPEGGNLDCTALGVGSTLYLPIAVPGAFFSAGDGHARQGDGEAGGTAIECPMARADLTFTLHDDGPLAQPRARLPDGWLTFGLAEDLEEATTRALSGMLDFLTARLGIDRTTALALASVAVEVRVTQLVNGVKGAHAFLADDALNLSV